jgi:hypothetical protein
MNNLEVRICIVPVVAMTIIVSWNSMQHITSNKTVILVIFVVMYWIIAP